LGVSGGIAAYKVANLARRLIATGADVRVVMTAAAARFVGPDTFAALTGNPVHTSLWEEPGTVLHVDLAHGVDVAVVAPATANVVAKLAHGLADDLLTTIALATRARMIVAPAMNVHMFENVAVQENLQRLRARGVRIVTPDTGAPTPGRLVAMVVVADEFLAPELARDVQARAGSAFSTFTPRSANAFWAFFASNLPFRASRESAAVAMDSALISKCRRRCSRLSLRPKPSVPSVTNRAPSQGASWSGTTFI
jgi:3-polyprenyl-4-hydroxybenzoate decarboxylase